MTIQRGDDRRTRRRLGPFLSAALASVAILAGSALAAGATVGDEDSFAGPRVVDEAAVTAMDQGAGFSNNSPLIVTDPAEPRFVVMANRVDAPDFGCALQVSGDGGRTWVTADPVAALPKGADKCYGPEAAFDAKGRLYYLFVGLQDEGNEPMGVFLVASDDRARSFTPPRRVLGPANFGVRMAIDGGLGERGRLHLLWLRAVADTPLGGFGPPPNPILASYSDDGGVSFSEPVQVSDQDRERVVAPALALGPDRAVHVAYYDLEDDARDYQGLEGPVWDGTWSLVLSSSFDGGRRFGAGRVVDESIVPHERVMLVFTMPPPALAAGHDGRLCLAWTDARHGDADALARCSPNQGRAWEPPRRLNDDRKGNGARQYLPRLAFSPQGRLDALFFDRRDDPRNFANHTYFTFSADGGARFSPNRRISRAPSSTRIGAQYANTSAAGQYEIGARLGLLSERRHSVAVWPDTRHSLQTDTGQDLVAATLAWPRTERPNRAARMAGVGLVVAGIVSLVGLALSRHRRRQPAAST